MSQEPARRLVPYEMVEPGFEAVYTGEKAAPSDEGIKSNPRLSIDDEGNVIETWPVWTWTFPGQEKNWGDEIKHINHMQEALGPLGDDVRQVRAHIGSLVPCEAGFPLTVDDLLAAIGRERFEGQPLHNGCWCGNAWWRSRGTQWGQNEAMAVIESCVREYLAGAAAEALVERFPPARGFILRMFEWLGPAGELTRLQRLMLERMLLPFEFFSGRNPSYEEVNRNCFEDGGRGRELDAQISALAGLPKVHFRHTREFRENLESIQDPEKRELYDIHSRIANGVHGLSDCHHATFRYVETWLHGIGTGKVAIPTRRRGAEQERLGRLVFGYALGLDKWLLGAPMQFVLIDLGHVDLGLDPKNEILRVYAYLGSERTPTKEWLAACLWHNLTHNDHGGLRGHAEIVRKAEALGVSAHEWMDSVLRPDIA